VIPAGAGDRRRFGAAGLADQRFRLQPFIVTLAGMFLARGLCYVISIDSISITDETFTRRSRRRACRCSAARRSIGGRADRAGDLRGRHVVAHGTEFGRNVYAIGGSEQSAC
jgi:ribose/xylose/arabinose/galactoside ABC-type transport system permease subunit